MKRLTDRKWEKISKKSKLDKKSINLRQKILDIADSARRGHIGSAFSSIDIVRVLFDYFLKYRSKNPNWEGRDRFIFSKGHGCMSLYINLAEKGFITHNELKTFCKPGSKFGGHPQFGKIPGVEASTGSLGHGMSLAVGMALAAKIKKQKWKTVILLSDGECNEGSTWEGILAVNKHRLDNLLVLVDYNKMQSYGNTYNVLPLENLAEKFESFGFKVFEVNGHEVAVLKRVIGQNWKKQKSPTVIICHTIKGKGVAFIEQNPEWHHKNLITDEEMESLRKELSIHHTSEV